MELEDAKAVARIRPGDQARNQLGGVVDARHTETYLGTGLLASMKLI